MRSVKYIIPVIFCFFALANEAAFSQSSNEQLERWYREQQERVRVEREKERQRYFSLRTWVDEERHALSLARSGVPPENKPSPPEAIKYLERYLGSFTGPEDARNQMLQTLQGIRGLWNDIQAEAASANAGNPDALYKFGGRHLRSGEGVPQDTSLGWSYIARAAERGHAQANYSMGTMLRDEAGKRPHAIAYMQEAYRLGNKGAANWLREWGAPLSAQHAAEQAKQAKIATTAASSFVSGAFAPLFWGKGTIDGVTRTNFTPDQLRPLLLDVKAGGVTFPTGAGPRVWGLPLGSAPTNLQFLAAAHRFNPCVTAPVTTNVQMGMDLSATSQLRFEEWKAGNRRAIYVQCAIGNSFFSGGSSNELTFYLIDNRLVAVRSVNPIYVGPQKTVGNRIYCAPMLNSPSQLFAIETKFDKAWKVAQQVSLEKKPLSGVRNGTWYTLTKLGAVMHIYPNNWPTVTQEGFGRAGQCGSGSVERLTVTPQLNGALQIDGKQLPTLRIGRPAQL